MIQKLNKNITCKESKNSLFFLLGRDPKLILVIRFHIYLFNILIYYIIFLYLLIYKI
jgi:hypothetical protein